MPTTTKSTSTITLPLVPRIDRLDSIMKILEEEKNVAKSSFDLDERKMPMDMAVREAELKGSLMDRVRSLENRLLQLCLEIESRGTSLQDTSVFQALKNNTVSSYSSIEFKAIDPPLLPTFQVQTEELKIKNNKKSEQKKLKNEDDDPRKNHVRSANKEQKTVATKKKAKHSTWFHLKLLGCS